VPLAPREPLSRREIASMLRTNVLASFGRRAFEDEVVATRLLFHRQVILNRPASIRHVLVDNAENYRRTPATIRLLYPITGTGLFLAEGDDWREQRRTVAPAFAPRTIPLLVPQIARATNELMANLITADDEVDLSELMALLALEIAGRSMFSLEMGEFGPLMRELLRGYGERLGRPTMLDILLPVGITAPRDFGRRRFRRRWLALINAIIAARQARPEEASAPRDLLDLLSKDGETGEPVAQSRLADQVGTMIAAGHATTAVVLFWSLFLVASVSEAQEHIFAEVETLDLGPENALAALGRLTYTRAVVSEALRLYPPAYSIVRVARRADNAAGVPVPAGTVVQISPWVLHRHRRLWTEPEAFDPSRFLPGAPAPDRFAYLPFGTGPRVCIGAQFALTEAVLVLARLVQAFEITRTSEEPVLPVAAITIQPDHPPGFRLKPRSGLHLSRPWKPEPRRGVDT
jgi:unspecific monooxygenase